MKAETGLTVEVFVVVFFASLVRSVFGFGDAFLKYVHAGLVCVGIVLMVQAVRGHR